MISPRPVRGARSALSPIFRILLPLSVLLLASHCGGENPEPNVCLDPCPCTDAGCPTGLCGLRVTLGASCAEDAPSVELLLGDCLEEVDLVPEAPRVACGFLLAGETGHLVARGETVQWGPFEVTCPGDGGQLFPVALDCP